MKSRSKEDYLKNIYQLQATGRKPNTTTLAKELNISAASVSEMISRLSAEGLLDNTPYYGFKLTSDGEKIAVNLIRKHRLIEVFLQSHLNYNWEDVHTEAERLEHVVSDDFIDKLEIFLGYPKFDPHGGPIPDRFGNVNDHIDHTLSSAAEGVQYIVTKVNDDSTEILKYLSTLGLTLNSKLMVKQKIFFDGSILILIGEKEHLLSKKISDNIYVMEPVYA